MPPGRLSLARDAILGHRRAANALDERLPSSAGSLRRAAWAGLQDSMPRAALLSIHARVAGTRPDTWEDPAFVQVWGPRFSVYVVAAEDLGVFSLGRLPPDAEGRRRAEGLAGRLLALLGGRRMRYGDAGHALGVNPNLLRYAAPTGTVLVRWDGARGALLWTVPPPAIDPGEARLELARRFLHVLGPATATAFTRWAGIGPLIGREAFERLGSELAPVRTPIGDASILAADEPSFRSSARPAAPARLLPSGDAFTLLHGAERELLVPNADGLRRLWTPRVWPGALLVRGEVVGAWRRADADVTIATWRRLERGDRDAAESEAVGLPLPGVAGRIRVRWEDG